MAFRRPTVLVAITVVLLSTNCGSGAATPPLDNGSSGSVTICVPSADAAVWARRQARPTVFGLDFITADQTVTIDSVELAGGGGLEIADASFIKGGGVGAGGAYGDTGYAASKASWAGRVEMPDAELSANGSKSQADQWQLVVGLLPIGDGGSATGARVSYHDGSGHAFAMVGRVGFGLVHGISCPAVGAANSSSAPSS